MNLKSLMIAQTFAAFGLVACGDDDAKTPGTDVGADSSPGADTEAPVDDVAGADAAPDTETPSDVATPDTTAPDTAPGDTAENDTTVADTGDDTIGHDTANDTTEPAPRTPRGPEVIDITNFSFESPAAPNPGLGDSPTDWTRVLWAGSGNWNTVAIGPTHFADATSPQSPPGEGFQAAVVFPRRGDYNTLRSTAPVVTDLRPGEVYEITGTIMLPEGVVPATDAGIGLAVARTDTFGTPPFTYAILTADDVAVGWVGDPQAGQRLEATARFTVPDAYDGLDLHARVFAFMRNNALATVMFDNIRIERLAPAAAAGPGFNLDFEQPLLPEGLWVQSTPGVVVENSEFEAISRPNHDAYRIDPVDGLNVLEIGPSTIGQTVVTTLSLGYREEGAFIIGQASFASRFGVGPVAGLTMELIVGDTVIQTSNVPVPSLDDGWRQAFLCGQMPVAGEVKLRFRVAASGQSQRLLIDNLALVDGACS